MKKLLAILGACVLILAAIVAVTPVSAGHSDLYESVLTDLPSPPTLGHGSVTIHSDLTAEIEFVTDVNYFPFFARLEYTPTSGQSRQVLPLGPITTDSEGRGEAEFNLGQLMPPDQMILAAPTFVIALTPDGPAAFTSVIRIRYPTTPPPPPGKIILEKQTSPSGGSGFTFIMSYGGSIGYPNGLLMNDTSTLDSGPLPPGFYVVREFPAPGWTLTSINIEETTTGSYFNIALGLAVINLSPGEIVHVTYNNSITP